MTMKNRRAVGTLGIAAVVAVLTVSMIAMNFTTQPIQAEAANKFGSISTTTTFLANYLGQEMPQKIVEYENKATDKQNIYGTVILECFTDTLVKSSGGKGKDKSTDEASAGAYIWFTISSIHGEEHLISPAGVIDPSVWDEETGSVPPANFWNVCGQLMELKVDLNPLIVKCTAEQAAALLCIEDQLVFLCDVDPTALAEDECDQFVQIFLSSWGTHSAATYIADIPHGTYYVSVWGDADIDLSDNVVPDERTKVAFGKVAYNGLPVNIDKSGG